MSAMSISPPNDPATHQIFTPVTLPCGRTVPNRLVKVALYEHAADLFGGPPNKAHFDLYARWSNGHWGMIVTGNVQVSKDHLTLGRDIVIPEEITPETLEPFRRLAAAIHHGSSSAAAGPSQKYQCTPLAIMQLNHAGRQSTRVIGGRGFTGRPLAPSPIRVGSTKSSAGRCRPSVLTKTMNSILFSTPLQMTLDEIDEVVDHFTRGAQVAAQSGFDGVQLHAAHGYLIAQFLTPKSNERTDEYSVRENALLLLHRIIESIRAPGVVPEGFVVGVKLNAADYVETDTTEKGHDKSSGLVPQTQDERALEHVREIAQWGTVDFIEISGGDYENPAFMSNSESPRQALFAQFSKRAMQVLHPPHATVNHAASPEHRPPLILLTGGLRTLPLLSSALSQNHAHLLGIGRLSVICPDLPRLLHNSIYNAHSSTSFSMDALASPDLEGLGSPPSAWGWASAERACLSVALKLGSLVPIEWPPLAVGGVSMAWYTVAMRRIARGEDPDYSVGGIAAIFRMWLWQAPESTQH